MIRPTLQFLRHHGPAIQAVAAAGPFIVWAWKELLKPFAHLPEMLEIIRSFRSDPWKPLTVTFVTSKGERYQVIEDSAVHLPRFCRDSKAD